MGRYAQCKVETAAKAHRLILREHSIEYIVKEYPAAGTFINGESAGDCACCRWTAGGIHEVYPLSDVTHARVEPCNAKFCGAALAPDTFTVKTLSVGGGMFPAVAIDGPLDGEAFAAAVMEQKAKVADTTLPPDVEQAYNQYMRTGACALMAAGAELGAQMMMGRQGPVVAMQPSASNQVAPASNNLAAQLRELADLKAAGALTDEEFAQAKARLLGGSGGASAPPPTYSKSEL